MKIEKGKLYYNTALGKLEKSTHTYEIEEGLLTDKIAVHCPTKEDWEYVVSKGYKLTTTWYKDSNYGLYSGTFFCSKNNYHVITIDQFKEFYPPQINIMKIEKGNKFLCIKDVVMSDGDVAYKKGVIYHSEYDCFISGSDGDSYSFLVFWTPDSGYDVDDYFKPLSEVDRIYTDATSRLRELYEGYKGDKFGDPTKAKFFGVKFSDGEVLYLSANDEYENPFFNRDYVTEDTFIELTGLTDKHVIDQDEYSWVNNGLQDISVKKTFNPQPYYDNSKGSLYKVATERGWNAYLFDLVKRLERGGKKDPLRQEIEKSIDVLKIWLNEID